MRSLKLAPFILLAGSLSFACNDGGDGGDDGGSGVGAGTGMSTGGSDGAGTGGGDGNTATGGGDGNGVTNPLCDNVVTATGTPPMIDDFERESAENITHLPEDGDGRVGQWEHESWNPAGGDRLFSSPAISEGVMRISCDGSADDGEWCGTEWDPGDPWVQWAAVSTRLTLYSDTDVNCYDASTFTGIKFKARSLGGEDKILLQAVTPDADPDLGWNYRSATINLTGSFEEYEVPFASVRMPDWVSGDGGPSGAVDAKALIAIAFAVRSVENHTMPNEGESLVPYDIEIDDVEFY